MKKTLLLIAIMAIGMSSCSITEDLEDPQGKELSPINFANGRVAGSTKSDIKTNTWADDVKVGIYAMKTEGAISTTPFDANFAKNMPLTYDDQAWKPGASLYWPANDKDRITFFAYHPHIYNSEGNIGEPVIKTDGDIEIKHVAGTNATYQTDLLWAWVRDTHKKDMIGSGTDNTATAVKFAFKHALTRIEFKASTKIDPSIATVTIRSLKVTANKTNTLTTTVPPLDQEPTATWGTASESVDFTIISPTILNTWIIVDNNPDVTPLTEAKHGMLMVPQSNNPEPTATTIDIGYTIEYQVPTGTQGAKPSVNETVTYPITTAWTQNAHIIYHFKIEPKEILFETTVGSWGTPTTTPLP